MRDECTRSQNAGEPLLAHMQARLAPRASIFEL